MARRLVKLSMPSAVEPHAMHRFGIWHLVPGYIRRDFRFSPGRIRAAPLIAPINVLHADLIYARPLNQSSSCLLLHRLYHTTVCWWGFHGMLGKSCMLPLERQPALPQIPKAGGNNGH